MLHGKFLTVIPYKCEVSSLAGALGKLKHSQDPGSNLNVCFINCRPLYKLPVGYVGFRSYQFA